MPRAQSIALPAYLTAAALVLATSSLIVRSPFFGQHPEIMARAVSLDIAVVLPVLYLLLARARGWPRIAVVPVFLLSLLAAHVVLPGEHVGQLRSLELLAVPAEVLAILFLLHKARRLTHRYRDARSGTFGFIEAAEVVLTGAGLGPRTTQIVLTEAAVVHYGLFAWGRKRPLPDSVEAFSYHTASGYGAAVVGFVFLICVETTLLHLALAPRIALLAWILSALGAYGTLFLAADFNAARRRPVLVDDRSLQVRIGFRWRASIPLAEIADVAVTSRDVSGKQGLLKAALIGDHNLVVSLHTAQGAVGIYGIRKRFDRVLLAVDEPARLARAIRSRLNDVRP